VCGRVTQTDPSRVASELSITGTVPDLGAEPRFNIAPSQLVPVVRLFSEREGRRLDLLRWGLVPSWAKDVTIGNKLINARVESAAEKSAFRGAFHTRRCLVVVDGFYEWQRQGRTKQPFHFRSESGELLVMAGLWERWTSPDGEIVETFTIVTKASEDRVKDIHDRMPAILSREHQQEWLDPGRHEAMSLRGLLAMPSPPLVATPVGTRVNKPEYDAPDCIEPVELQPGLFD
jgi:putative SOS response-associated peptidase YedK